MRDHALSFAAVAEAYDRARPSYPADAVAWLVGSGRARVLELGAGTGKLTELLVAAGHDVVATDPLPEMLARLRARVPAARAVVASAERIPVPSQSVDVVVCAQSFHWFDHEVALPEMARVLRPDGVLALVWNARDEGIPWVRKLGRLLDEHGARIPESSAAELPDPARESVHFGWLEHQQFRFWQTLRRDELFDLVRSRSSVALLEDAEREKLLARVGALYDDYGRGPDGMQLPYLTHCYRAVVKEIVPPPPPPPPPPPAPGRVDWADLADPDSTQPVVRIPPQAGPPEDPGTLLIDFS
ncbi:MAG TPA: class I SAM-dependent methyltransferase [Marmoricola sp.]|nr:class I SAM-dependent methyltransferase [Marmoricola sp.]